jgi:hypothetical protein
MRREEHRSLPLPEPRDLTGHVRTGLSDRELEAQIQIASARFARRRGRPLWWLALGMSSVAVAAALAGAVPSVRRVLTEALGGGTGARPRGGPAEARRRPDARQPPPGALAAGAPLDEADQQEARAADAFADSLGVHLWVAEDKRRAPLVRERLLQLGVRHVTHVAHHENSLDFVNAVAPPSVQDHVLLKDDRVSVAVIRRKLGDRLGSVQFNWRFGKDWQTRLTIDPAWAAGVRTGVEGLWRSVKDDPALAGIVVVGPSVRYPYDVALVGDLSPWVDMGAFDPRNAPARPGVPYLDEELAGMRRAFADKPLVASKIVYCTGGGVRDVSETVQAKYLTRALLEHFNRGIVRTFVDGLFDRQPSKRKMENQCGLVRTDGSPKPAFTALARLLAVTSDPGPVQPPAERLRYRVLQAPPELHRVLLQKRDGRFLIALWLEIDSGDHDQRRAVVVELARAPRAVTLHRLAGGAPEPVRSPEATRFEITVSDAPIVIELQP